MKSSGTHTFRELGDSENASGEECGEGVARSGLLDEAEEKKTAPAEIIGRIWRLTFTSRVNVHRGLLRRAAEQKQLRRGMVKFELPAHDAHDIPTDAHRDTDHDGMLLYSCRRQVRYVHAKIMRHTHDSAQSAMHVAPRRRSSRTGAAAVGESSRGS